MLRLILVTIPFALGPTLLAADPDVFATTGTVTYRDSGASNAKNNEKRAILVSVLISKGTTDGKSNAVVAYDIEFARKDDGRNLGRFTISKETYQTWGKKGGRKTMDPSGWKKGDVLVLVGEVVIDEKTKARSLMIHKILDQATYTSD